ncbi:MAG TPA: NHL repeat-containing protein [Candidatus Eisenbacteria bacterium]|jgi:hypothetical protein
MKLVSKALAAVTLAALLPMAPPVEAAQPPALLASWSTGDIPTGLAIGPDGKVYVGGQDGGSALVRVFLQDGTPTGLIGAGNGQEAYGLAFLSDGRLLVAEYYRHVVDQFAPDGTNLGSWAVPGSNDLFLAVDGTDNVFLTDDNGDMVRHFTSGGALIAQWPSPHPAGIYCLNGLVYVAGMFNGLMSVYDAEGTPQGSFPTGCTFAEQLGTDGLGNLLLEDHGLGQLKCFQPDGTLLWILGPSVPAYGPGTCNFFSVALGNGGAILAGDYTNRRVLVLGSQTTPTAARSWSWLKARYR